MARDDTAPTPAPETKSDTAFAVLRARILDGTYGPGHTLVIGTLGAELGMSAIPVREAVRRLEAEGWVVTRRHAGARVAPADAGGLVAHMELLAVLEGSAMGLLARRDDPFDLRPAERLNDRMRTSLTRLNVLDTARLNREFHEALYGGVQNAPLVAHLRQTWDQLGRMRRSAAFYLARAHRSVEEHDLLLAMLDGGAEPDAVERFARRHRLATLEVLLRDDPEMAGQRSLLLTDGTTPEP